LIPLTRPYFGGHCRGNSDPIFFDEEIESPPSLLLAGFAKAYLSAGTGLGFLPFDSFFLSLLPMIFLSV
jgi:hypothetical protein